VCAKIEKNNSSAKRLRSHILLWGDWRHEILGMNKQNAHGMWWQSWLKHCATSQKIAGSIPNGVTGNFL